MPVRAARCVRAAPPLVAHLTEAVQPRHLLSFAAQSTKVRKGRFMVEESSDGDSVRLCAGEPARRCNLRWPASTQAAAHPDEAAAKLAELRVGDARVSPP